MTEEEIVSTYPKAKISGPKQLQNSLQEKVCIVASEKCYRKQMVAF